MLTARWALCGLAFVAAAGCVYPHRHTSLTPITRDRTTSSFHAPTDIWQLTVVEAHIRPRNRGDVDWDDGGGLPDAFVRIYRGEELVWQSETVNDTLEPRWDETLPANLHVDTNRTYRFEVWDSDTVGSDPVGMFRRHGLPDNAVPDADARVMLEGGSYLTIRVRSPQPHRGVGIRDYEVHPEALVVVQVETHSPAGRAGIEAGDRIVGIDEQSISDLNDAQAASALSMSANRESRLRVVDANGREREVELDRGYVWLTM